MNKLRSVRNDSAQSRGTHASNTRQNTNRARGGGKTYIEIPQQQAHYFARSGTFLNSRLRLELAELQTDAVLRHEFVSYVKSAWATDLTSCTATTHVKYEKSFDRGGSNDRDRCPLGIFGGTGSSSITPVPSMDRTELMLPVGSLSRTRDLHHPTDERLRYLRDQVCPSGFFTMAAQPKAALSTAGRNQSELPCLLLFSLAAFISGASILTSSVAEGVEESTQSTHSQRSMESENSGASLVSADSKSYTNADAKTSSTKSSADRGLEQLPPFPSSIPDPLTANRALAMALLSVARAVSEEDMEEELKRPDWADDVFAFLQSLTSVSIAIAAVKEENIPSRFRVTNASSLLLYSSSSSSVSSASFSSFGAKQVVNTCPIVFANEAFTALSGRSIASVLGKSVDVLQGGDFNCDEKVVTCNPVISGSRSVSSGESAGEAGSGTGRGYVLGVWNSPPRQTRTGSPVASQSQGSLATTCSIGTTGSMISMSSLFGPAPLKLMQPARSLFPSRARSLSPPISPRFFGLTDPAAAGKNLVQNFLEKDDEHFDEIFDQFVLKEDMEATVGEERSRTPSERGQRGEKAEMPAFIDLDPLFSRATSECLYVLHVQRVYEKAKTPLSQSPLASHTSQQSIKLDSTVQVAGSDIEGGGNGGKSGLDGAGLRGTDSTDTVSDPLAAVETGRRFSSARAWRALSGRLATTGAHTQPSIQPSTPTSSAMTSATKHRLKPQARNSSGWASGAARSMRAGEGVGVGMDVSREEQTLRALFQRDEDVVRAFLERILLAD